MDQRVKEEIKGRWEEILQKITEPAKARVNGHQSYVCPFCGHGKGGDGLTFDPASKDGNSLHCFGSCGFYGDIFTLIGKYHGIDSFPEQVKKAGEYLGIDIDGEIPPANASKPAQNQPKTERKEEKDNTPYYRECQARLKGTDYHRRRGFSDEEAIESGWGRDPAFKTKDHDTGEYVTWDAIIIPVDAYSYIARNTDPEATGDNRYRERGEKKIYNAHALRKGTKPIFIVEGVFDARSITAVGGEAIALRGAGINKLVNEHLKKYPPAQPLVIALDNDTAGQEATKQLEAALQELGTRYYVYNPAGDHKDANEALLADREAFTQAVEYAAQLEKEALEAEKEEYLRSSSASHLQEFMNGIAESVNTPATPTGFPILDHILDGGLYAGLHTIGAISSLGKTSFMLQVMDQIADSGQDVIIFSLEMARSELMAKSISRLTLLDILENDGDIHHAKTTRGILAGAKYKNYSREERDLINRAIEAYSKYAKHIFIHEGIGNIGVERVRETIEKHIRITGQSPVVLIDYAQILAPVDIRASDKQNTDKNVLELKRISRDCKIPVLIISSFNRENYQAPVNMASFKESGAIEYSSDVLLGLQYTGMDYKEKEKDGDRQKRIRQLIKDMAERATAGEAQDIELKILKNRNGGRGKVQFSFYPRFNYFKEAGKGEL